MFDLDRHWRDVLTVLLQNVACGQAQHQELAQTAEHIRADYKGRFLVELIQNAADQAGSAGLESARILIVWRGGLLAVANQGARFTEAGIRSITSLGLSTKRPDQSIGNKGVGFKAVFEVAGAPEIFGAGSPGADLSTGLPDIRFRMSADPFSLPGVMDRANQLIAEIRAVEPTLDARLLQRPSDDEALEAHVRRAPPFKFPLPLDATAWERRIEQLRLRPDDLGSLQTMVVLPLLEGTEDVVARQIDSLADDDGAVALFLPGVARIDVLTEDASFSVNRRDLHTESLEGGAFRVRETTVEGARAARRRWWMLERTLGRTDDERVAVRDAVKGLPGEGWQKVEAVPVAVALPQPDAATLAMPVDGKYVIGLPTLDLTGLAWWVNGHFHGTISRKGIDLDGNRLNQLILRTAATMIPAVLSRLRDEPACAANPPLEHFALALALRGEDSHLWRALTDGYQPFDERLVLAPDGESFLTLGELLLPKGQDRALLLLADVTLSSPTLADTGLRLPHPRLLALGSDDEDDDGFLECTVAIAPPSVFLGTTGQSPTPLETWALAHRADGPAFWRPFLTWAASRLTKQIGDLQLIPVDGGLLARPRDWVFHSLTSGDTDAPAPEDLDAGLVGTLNFADSAPCSMAPTNETTSCARPSRRRSHRSFGSRTTCRSSSTRSRLHWSEPPRPEIRPTPIASCSSRSGGCPTWQPRPTRACGTPDGWCRPPTADGWMLAGPTRVRAGRGTATRSPSSERCMGMAAYCRPGARSRSASG